MKNSPLSKGLVSLIFANLITFASSLISGFVVPGILGLKEYSYWQTFVLYTAYVGFFHFGFLDGLYVKNGKYDYVALNKGKFKGYLYFTVILELIITCIGIFIGIFFFDGMTKIIIIMLSISVLTQNIITYFSYICQITQRFGIYAKNTMISRLIFWISIGLILLIGFKYALLFMISQLLIDSFIIINFAINNKEIVFEQKAEFDLKEIKRFFSIGFMILLANFIVISTMRVGSIYVNNVFSTTDFSIYAFASNIMSIIGLFINSLAMFLFPYLSRVEEKYQLKDNYSRFSNLIIISAGFFINVYFAAELIINLFLKKFALSIELSAFLFTTQMYTAQIYIVSNNYFKRLEKKQTFIVSSLIGLLINIIYIVAATKLDKSLFSVGISVYLAAVTWVFVNDLLFHKILGTNFFKKNIGLLVLSCSFLVIANMKQTIFIRIPLYNLVYFIVISVFFRTDFLWLLSIIRTKLPVKKKITLNN
ncbi:oligosaccharide flippase family protein [Fictibacillus gelatini]|uniref:oligosaccharide flippase family protein n=1 Tax=Fictibacillus gelatini TaxID=225985 RepID=UPI0004274B25|nr:oligosaccharide flippase family protein [Fictibacillus gelatini]